jgi:hypothetical protein
MAQAPDLVDDGRCDVGWCSLLDQPFPFGLADEWPATLHRLPFGVVPAKFLVWRTDENLCGDESSASMFRHRRIS